MTRQQKRSSSALASWRTALRIAWQESRRAKWRSALVAALIAVPVLGLSFAAASYDMFQLTPAERLARTLGTADARVTWEFDGPLEQNATGGDVTSQPREHLGRPQATDGR